MGKREKKQRHQQKNPHRGASYYAAEQDDDYDYQLSLPSSSYSSDSKPSVPEEEEEEEEEEQEQEQEDDKNAENPSKNMPSKFDLYQQSVQSPKGDISYMQKFFLMYVGGRLPLYLQEDFCGTALLSAEWIRSNSRRTAVGLDLDLEALNWCLEKNISRVGADGYSRISLFHGNVLQPLEAKLVNFEPQELISKITLQEGKDGSETCALESTVQVGSTADDKYMKSLPLPPRDIVCAFNYSCCCLHKRAELVLYFKHVHDALSKKGGIFVMDLYGGTSSEHKLRLKRRFANFTYVWEQAEFDVVERKTRISLHFLLQKQQKKLRHAFSYSWRLWSLPEIKDCLEEAGFRSVHFWLREMPDTEEIRTTEGFGEGRDVKYEEVKSFQQQDAWNAYIVGVA
ncbi:hypothetical protein ACB098_08G119000 [Castanea mollissima]